MREEFGPERDRELSVNSARAHQRNHLKTPCPKCERPTLFLVLDLPTCDACSWTGNLAFGERREP